MKLRRFDRARSCCFLTILLLAFPAGLRAEEEVVQNDKDGTQVPFGDFVAGEQAGARLTSPCDGTIVGVQVLWAGTDPGAIATLERAIHIYNGPSFPVPSTELLYLEAPLLEPGFINEFRYIDEGQTQPIAVPVVAGQQVYVTLEFENATDIQNGSPSVVRDTDGCQAGKNVLYGNLGLGFNWYNVCDLQTPGFKGDLAIRMIVDCPGAVGACCHASGTCDNDVEAVDCDAFGDVWTQGGFCGEVTCNARGACCRAGGCLQLVTEADCESAPLNGVYAGDGTNCADSVCVAGACCDLLGGCSEVFEVQCTGDFSGPGTSCTPNPCTQPEGACCIDTFCQGGQTLADCVGAAGAWAGPFTTCSPNPCPICSDGDADQDGDVDLRDFAVFQTCYGLTGSGDCECIDMNNDYAVDADDVPPFTSAVSAGGPTN